MCLAVPGKVLSIDPSEAVVRCGEVDFGGVSRRVNLAYTPEAEVGDYVLVHVGFAIKVLKERQADEVFRLWEDLQ